MNHLLFETASFVRMSCRTLLVPTGFLLNCLLFAKPMWANDGDMDWYYKQYSRIGTEAGGDPVESRGQTRFWNRFDAGAEWIYAFDDVSIGGRAGADVRLDYRYYNSQEDHNGSYIGLGDFYAFSKTSDTLLQAGQWDFSTDQDGFVYRGRNPTLYGRIAIVEDFQLGVFGFLADREDRLLDENTGTERFMGGEGLFRYENLRGKFWGGFYRSPGRAAIPSQVVTVSSNQVSQAISLNNGRGAIPDQDVRYYGASLEYTYKYFSSRMSLFGNHGRQISVSTDGSRVGSTRKSIHGYAGYFSLAIHDSAKNRSIELAGLGTTRDRNDSDDRLLGFGSIRPELGIMGGESSIFLYGIEPAGERAAFHNFAPNRYFSEMPLAEDRHLLVDNRSPAPPDYGNNGLNMGSIHGALPLWKLNADLYLNYADFLKGDGIEGIFRITYKHKDWFSLFGSATGASYKSSVRIQDSRTGLTKAPKAKYYSRWMAGIDIIL